MGTPILSNLQESWSKGSHAARELATVFSVTFFSNNRWSIGQNALQKVSRHRTTPKSPRVIQVLKGLLRDFQEIICCTVLIQFMLNSLHTS